jgi:hypothetical protein
VLFEVARTMSVAYLNTQAQGRLGEGDARPTEDAFDTSGSPLRELAPMPEIRSPRWARADCQDSKN